jgi:hypothetical protein
MNHAIWCGLAGILFASAPATQAAGALPESPMANTATLHGRVMDMLGEPVVAAKLQVMVWDRTRTVQASGRTDGEGMFRIRAPKLPMGDFWLVEASAEGRCAAVAATLNPEEPILITVHDAAQLRGTLRDDAGKPVANALVFARSTEHCLHQAESQVTTDTLGNFVLPNVALGPTMVGAFVVGQGLMQAHLCVQKDATVQLVPTPGPQTSIHVTLEGLPKDASKPVALSLHGHGGRPLMMLPLDMREIAIVGNEWSLEHLPDWRFTLDTLRSGYVVAPAWHALEKGHGPHRVTLTITPTQPELETTVAVVVRDALGKPVDGVAMWMLAFGANVRVKAHTDASGRVAFRSPLGKGSAALLASADPSWVIDREVREHHSGAQTQAVVVDPEQTVELRVVPACCVAGVVRLPNGKPAAFVEVELCESSSQPVRRGGTRQWLPVASLTTRADGSFAFPDGVARKNPVRLQVAGAFGSATSDAIVIREPGTRITDCELQLQAPGVVAGVVHGPDGQPAAGEVVRATPAGQSGYTEVVTDKLGRYRLAGLREGTVAMHIVRGGQIVGGEVAVAVLAGEAQQRNLQAPAQSR